MKSLRKYCALVALCVCVPAQAVDAPTTDTLKQQFSGQFGGILQLQSVTLKPLEEKGNQATWMAEGDIAADEDLYAFVGMAADYRFLEKTWTKGKPVKFSAMVTSVGTQASGWRAQFFSMQMAAKNAGYPLKEMNGSDKDLTVNSDDFYPRLRKIEAGYAASAAEILTLKKKQDKLVKAIEDSQAKINGSWGVDKNGKSLSRMDFMQVKLNAMYQVDKQNYPSIFEENYNKTVYDPALAACQAKPSCDAEPLRKARDIAVDEQRRRYHTQHEVMKQKIEDEMAERDAKLKPLYEEQGAYRREAMDIEMRRDKLQSDYDRWQRDITELRRLGVIH